jgi:hypothetical protein
LNLRSAWKVAIALQGKRLTNAWYFPFDTTVFSGVLWSGHGMETDGVPFWDFSSLWVVLALTKHMGCCSNSYRVPGV